MTNIFSDVRRLVLAAIGDLMARGRCRRGSIWQRVAVEPPRDPAHGDLATNAAMVLAGAVRENPMALAERIGAALNGRELVTEDYRGPGLTVAAARPGFLNITLAPEIWHAQLRADPARRCRFWRFGSRRRREGQCRIRLGQPDRANACRPRQGRCRWRCARGVAGQGRVPSRARVLHQRRRRAGRYSRPLDPSALSRGPRRGDRAAARRVLSRRISDRNRPGARPRATGENGSIGRKASGSPRCATLPSRR